MYIVSRDLIERSGISDPELTLALIEQTFRSKSAGTSAFAQEVAMARGKVENGAFYSLPAYLGQEADAIGVAGLKWTSHIPRTDAALPYTQPIILLNNLETGQPIALLEGELISGLRTGAVSAAAIRTLADPTADSLLLCGSGYQAGHQLRSLLPVLPGLKELHLWSRSPIHARRLHERFADELFKRNIRVRVHRELPARLDFAKIVVGATSAAEPYLTAEHFVPGHLYVHIGMRDIAAAAIPSFDTIVCDDYLSGVSSSSQSLFGWAREHAEIQQKVILLEQLINPSSDPSIPDAKLDIRQTASRKLMFNAFGLSMFDLALARETLSRLLKSSDLADQPPSFDLLDSASKKGGW
ncbi:hypothetical protein [Saccharibacillus sacchari]|uniref:Uncharacterized protein n=1 Tax=Saccharibacillus sacchari TaxID=456493 RepID=A0ACC6PFB1_9BACL